MAQAVGHRVIGGHDLRRALREVLIGLIQRIEEVIAIGVQRQSGNRAVEREAQRLIRIAVVGPHIAGHDRAVLDCTGGVGQRGRSIRHDLNLAVRNAERDRSAVVEREHLGLGARGGNLVIVIAVAGRITGARGRATDAACTAAGVACAPVDRLVAEENIEIAIARADELHLEGVHQIGMLRVVADIIPSDGERAGGGVEIPIDQVRPSRGAARTGSRRTAPGVNVSPKNGDDRIVGAGINSGGIVAAVCGGKGDIAVIVDVERRIKRPEKVQALRAKHGGDVDRARGAIIVGRKHVFAETRRAAETVHQDVARGSGGSIVRPGRRAGNGEALAHCCQPGRM